ncbi:MAG TPA: serine/threonine-protein kinase [Amycolatopsis sp.]|uniref:serine/threonine-protein kinase n=1 Tax=Amycolatopsis sp. TaxID=37632 RepID=UPI002B4A39E8|nr:serine/threonine-protein kinase [Amycolatopsis sp.]HKS49311.1 serine/threonine-protein kinase [Amycolatopsis sp.]
MTEEQTTQRAVGPRVIAGRYPLLAELGRGGMGVVWRGEDTVIGRPVAIKELRLPDGAEDTVFGERVLREVRTGGRLNDPAVVTVYDVVAEQGGTFIVMELVEAPTLADLVRAHGPLPPAQVASIGQQVLSALQAAHQAGIVHRDVKPGNIMVAPNGRVKLTDFGIAQAVDDPRLTTSGMIIGSPAFMAPERVAGKEAVPASDLWSLGATLFFAVEGTMAFERPTTAATLHAIMNEVPYLTRGQGPLASAIMGLLIASPEARISVTQAHSLLAMAAASSGQPTPPGGRGTMMYPGPAPTRVAPAGPGRSHRKPLLVGGAILGVALLVGGILLGRWWATPGTDEAMLPTLSYGEGGQVSTLETNSGYACTNKVLDAAGLTEDDWVDCKSLHYLQYYDGATVFGDSESNAVAAPYPDQGRLKAWAESRCALGFYSRTTQANDVAELSYRALVPSQKAWETQKDGSSSSEPLRRVYCMLGKRDNTSFTGSRSVNLN